MHHTLSLPKLECKSRLSSLETRCLQNSIFSPVPWTIAPTVVQLQGDTGERVEGRRRIIDSRGANTAKRKVGTNAHSERNEHADQHRNHGTHGIGDSDGDECRVYSAGLTLESPRGTDGFDDSVSAQHIRQHHIKTHHITTKHNTTQHNTTQHTKRALRQ